MSALKRSSLREHSIQTNDLRQALALFMVKKTVTLTASPKP